MLKLLSLVSNILSSLPSSFASLKLLVEVDKDHSENETTNNGDTEHGQDDTVRLAIAVFRQVPHVRAGNITELGKGVDHSDGNCSLGRRTREGRRDPGVAAGLVSHWKCGDVKRDAHIQNNETGIGLGLQEEGNVSASSVEGGHTDDETDHSEKNRDSDVPKLKTQVSLMAKKYWNHYKPSLGFGQRAMRQRRRQEWRRPKGGRCKE